jgi:hypothetical protein
MLAAENIVFRGDFRRSDAAPHDVALSARSSREFEVPVGIKAPKPPKTP